MGKPGPLNDLIMLAAVVFLVLPGVHAEVPLYPGINEVSSDVLADIITYNGKAGGAYFDGEAVLGGPLFSCDLYMAPTTAYPRSLIKTPIETETGDAYQIAAFRVLDEYTYADTVMVTRDDISPDSLAAAAYAKKNRIPILLVKAHEVPIATYNAIQDLGAKNFIILGGVEAVGIEVEEPLGVMGTVRRVGGKTRYETAAMLAGMLDRPGAIVITKGENPSTDAALVAAIYRIPMVYVTSTGIPDATRDFLMKNKETFLGQPMTVALVDIEPALAHEITALMATDKWGADIEVSVKNDDDLGYWIDISVNKQALTKYVDPDTTAYYGTFHVDVGEVQLKTRWFDYDPDVGAFREKTYPGITLGPGEKTTTTLGLN